MVGLHLENGCLDILASIATDLNMNPTFFSERMFRCEMLDDSQVQKLVQRNAPLSCILKASPTMLTCVIHTVWKPHHVIFIREQHAPGSTG